jgi:membrane-bound lytic murein transglycosylase F
MISLAATMWGSVCGAMPAGSPLQFRASWRGYAPLWNVREATQISDYDPIIREVASSRGYDWRLISAIACAESRFRSDAVSGAGAVGLMQVMPSVARSLGVPPQKMYDPLVNVTMGVTHLERIAETFRFPRTISERDRLSITLAAYNCGPGRVLDARRLAAKYGENHNSWSVVSKYLGLMGDPAYYADEVVRCGIFRDSAQTLGFVRNVMRYYDSYCRIAAL